MENCCDPLPASTHRPGPGPVTGPLTGVRVVELAGIGPGPFTAMLLADLGADVIRVDRRTDPAYGLPSRDVLLRGRRSIAVDLKQPEGLRTVLKLVAGAEVLIEGFRPGVAERLGLGPDQCLAAQPALVYGRMTGWGQTGPLSATAGHDINYIALTGALDGFRRAGERPTPPMNLLGDLGGGALYLAFGILAAVLEARASKRGQVVDANIVDGTASLMNFILGLRAQGAWNNPPGHNALDTGSPYYDTYTCADEREIALGALEPQFYLRLLELTGVTEPAVALANRDDPAYFDAARRCWSATFRTRTRDDWAALLGGSDACAAPVLSIDEARQHPQLAERGTYLERDGILQAAPAPRFSRTTVTLGRPPCSPGQHTNEILAEQGFDRAQIDALREAGVVR